MDDAWREVALHTHSNADFMALASVSKDISHALRGMNMLRVIPGMRAIFNPRFELIANDSFSDIQHIFLTVYDGQEKALTIHFFFACLSRDSFSLRTLSFTWGKHSEYVSLDSWSRFGVRTGTPDALLFCHPRKGRLSLSTLALAHAETSREVVLDALTRVLGM